MPASVGDSVTWGQGGLLLQANDDHPEGTRGRMNRIIVAGSVSS